MDIATTQLLHNIPALILGGVLLFREWQNWKDRKDLLDRLMSADFKEYKKFTRPEKTPAAFPAAMTDEEMAKAEQGK